MSTISVIMPARNAAKTIRQSVASVLQDPLVTQLIIVDDRSGDDTKDVVQNIGDERICLISGPGEGISAAFNCGLAEASGDFLARCDADDLYPAGRMGWQLSRLLDHMNCVAVSGGFRTITMDDKVVAELAIDGVPRAVTSALLTGEPITHFCTWLVRSKVLKEIGGARCWFESAEDLDLQFRLAARGEIWHIPRLAYLYRLHETSITHRQAKSKVDFFETKAKEFAKERLLGKRDPLEQGTPPPVPSSSRERYSAKEDITGQLVGKSWHLFHDAQYWQAFRAMVQTLRTQPLSLGLWRGFVAMMLKWMRKKS